MNPVHRDIIKDKRDRLAKNVCLQKLEPFVKEYKIFNKSMWEDIKTVSDMFEALPCRGPKAFQNIIEILRKAGYKQEADILEKPNLTSDFRNLDLYYRMSSNPLGYCLIINNVNFEEACKRGKVSEEGRFRYGSDVDAESLLNFFESIGYVVTTETNLKAKEMMNCIEAFSKQDFFAVDAMVLIILSHGGQLENRDFICGTDGGEVFKDQMYDLFNNEKCENLQNKPKVFFFIACRGKKLDYGVKESIDSSAVIVPLLTDIFIFHSTLPYHVSVRDHEKGSFFCEALISVLKEYHQVYDLETMVKLVNSKLKNKISKEFRITQVAHVENIGGTKRIMLRRTY